MATLQLNNLPDDLLLRIRQLAEYHQVSLDEQVVQLLQQATSPPKLEEKPDILQLLEAGQRQREQLSKEINWLDSTALIREDRDR
jgi:antitoxin FitA